MSTVVNLAVVGIMRLWPLWLCCLWLPVSTVSAAKLESPPGFSVEALPFSVPNARQMALTPGGHLIVGTRRKGRVYAVINALEDDNPRVVTLLNKLDMPSGVAMLGSDLYIAALSRVCFASRISTISSTTSLTSRSLVTTSRPTNTTAGSTLNSAQTDSCISR